MKNPFNLITKSSKTGLVLGALTVATALGSAGAAQAAPFDRGPGWGESQQYGRRPHRGDRNDRRVFTGVVNKDRGNNLFDVRIDGKNYNVYTINRTPRRLDKGDIVRVTGKRVGANDIREARVEIIRNR